MWQLITNISISLFAAIGVIFLINLAGSFILFESWALWNHYIGRMLIVTIVLMFQSPNIPFSKKKDYP